MAADNSEIYRFAGYKITLNRSELKDDLVTKYYIGNFSAGSPPNINSLTKLESQRLEYGSQSYKIIDTDGNDMQDIDINDNNQIYIRDKDVAAGTYYIKMNNNIYNKV